MSDVDSEDGFGLLASSPVGDGLASLASSDEDDAYLNVDDRDGPVPMVGRFHRTLH